MLKMKSSPAEDVEEGSSRERRRGLECGLTAVETMRRDWDIVAVTWQLTKKCSNCGAEVQWTQAPPKWTMDKFAMFTACPVCTANIYLREDEAPTVEELKAWIEWFSAAGEILSDAVTDVTGSDEEGSNKAEKATEAWRKLDRDWRGRSRLPSESTKEFFRDDELIGALEILGRKLPG